MSRFPPVWDLRRGDADADRSSPHGRGWTSMIFSAALEVNYLSAAIAFLLLLVGPALMLGLIPPLVAKYGHRAVATSVSLAHPRLAALVVLALVAGAITIARPLLSAGLDLLWQLKYTLVVPLFVALRELVCFALERWFGKLESPEQFARRRRIGATIATLVFAGGALLFTVAIEFSSGKRIVAAVDARLWNVAIAGLRNAAVIIALTTAFTAIQWLWREFRVSQPVRAWAASRGSRSARSVNVAHISDPHLVAGRYEFRMEGGTGGPRGNARFRRALRHLAELDARSPFERIVVTGDITDAGTRAEWIEFEQILCECPTLRAKVMFVPGNHDVNIIDAANPGRLDLPGSMGQALRRLRVVLALDEIQGTSVHVVDARSGTLGPTLSEYLRIGARQEALRELAETGSRRGRSEMRRVWNAIFPLVAPPTRESALGVMLLDSNGRRHLSLTNAIGVVGRPQLRAMRRIVRSSGHPGWLIVLHHHVVEYPDSSIGLKERVGVALANAPDVLDALSGSHVLLLHGHRHRDWIGSRDGITLCSAPSVTLGSYNLDRKHGFFHVYEVGLSDDGGIALNRSRLFTVA